MHSESFIKIKWHILVQTTDLWVLAYTVSLTVFRYSTFFYWIKKERERERNLKSTEYRYFKLMKRIYQNLIGENRSAPVFHQEKGLRRTASECTTAEKRRLLEKLKLKPQGFLCFWVSGSLSDRKCGLFVEIQCGLLEESWLEQESIKIKTNVL